MMRCEARYVDRAGALDGVMEVGPRGFALEVGGVRFEGEDFFSLKACAHELWAEVARFELREDGVLIRCELEWAQPVELVGQGQGRVCVLWVQVVTRYGLDGRSGGTIVFGLELEQEQLTVASYSYDELLGYMERRLGPVRRLRCCYSCERAVERPFYGAGLLGTKRCMLGHEEALALTRAARDPLAALEALIDEARAPRVGGLHVCERYL